MQTVDDAPASHDDPLLKAVGKLQLEGPHTVKEIYALLQEHDELRGCSLSDVKRACSKNKKAQGTRQALQSNQAVVTSSQAVQSSQAAVQSILR